jgi:hypothetical protein
MRKLKHSRFGLLLVLAALAVFVAVPSLAVAQSSSSDPSKAVYTDNIPSSSEGTSGSSGGLDSQIGSLPFTGMDLIILAGVALVLTGTGFALRRLSTPRGPRV